MSISNYALINTQIVVEGFKLTNLNLREIKICKENHSKGWSRFHIEKSCRFKSDCANLHPDHFGEGNKKNIIELKEKLENHGKATKEEINQRKATAQIK